MMSREPVNTIEEPPSEAAGLSSRGTKVAALVAIALAIALGAGIASRVKQAKATQAAIASQRESVVAAAMQRAPLRSAAPVPLR